jgi:hypothetical protein
MVFFMAREECHAGGARAKHNSAEAADFSKSEQIKRSGNLPGIHFSRFQGDFAEIRRFLSKISRFCRYFEIWRRFWIARPPRRPKSAGFGAAEIILGFMRRKTQ